MIFFKTYEKFTQVSLEDFKETIMRLKKIPKELKEVACGLVRQYEIDGKKGILTTAKNGVISSLELHPDFLKILKEKDYPTGFSMGIDKNGYFIHTHRARSKSHKSFDKITAKEIKFIDSTG